MSGYVIALNKGRKQFFTSQSSYDRPRWTSLEEATVYPTADIANAAAAKLWKYGHYSASLVEATSLQFEMPDEEKQNLPPINDTSTEELPPDDLDQDQDQEGGEMTAGQLSDDSEEDLNLDDEDALNGSEFDIDHSDDAEMDGLDVDHPDEFSDEDQFNLPPEEENEQAFLSPVERLLMKGKRPSMPSGSGPKMSASELGEAIIREMELEKALGMLKEFSMPKKPPLNGASVNNATIATDLPKTKKVEFKQDTRDDAPDVAKVIEPLYKDVQIPANVMAAIKDSIATFDKAADFNNGRDDAQASLALTVADALRTIQDCLSQGTHEGLKQAQIKITTFMNPITTNFPPEVIDFLYKSGRQPMSLKNAFYDKWDNRK